MEIGIDVPLLSIMTPFRGTPIYSKLRVVGRILDVWPWSFYNGYNVAFIPKKLSEEGLLRAHRTLWKKAFSPLYSLKRICRGLITLRLGAFLLSLFMNSFYCYKRVLRNYPIDMTKRADLNAAVPPTVVAHTAMVRTAG